MWFSARYGCWDSCICSNDDDSLLFFSFALPFAVLVCHSVLIQRAQNVTLHPLWIEMCLYVVHRIIYGTRVSIQSVHILCYYFYSRFMLKVIKRCAVFFLSLSVSFPLSLSLGNFLVLLIWQLYSWCWVWDSPFSLSLAVYSICFTNIFRCLCYTFFFFRFLR